MIKANVKLLLVALFVVSLAAWAQTGPATRAYNRGYDAGFRQGQAEAATGKLADYTKAFVYRRALQGWTSAEGDRETYRQNFRSGFQDGYNDGFNGDQPSVVSGGQAGAIPTIPGQRSAVAQGAWDQGYRSGYAQGQTDSGYQYNPTASAVYQNATQGYDSSQFPSLEDYKFNFRQGFEAGYDDGYNGRGMQRRNAPRGFGVPYPNAAATTYGNLITVPAGTVIKLRLNNTISTRSSQPGDRFTATVADPVMVNDQMAIPSGSVISGTVTEADRAGRISGNSELHLRYDTITLPGDAVYNLNAVTTGAAANVPTPTEEGTVQGKSSTGKSIGEVAAGAGLGALIGAIAGGGKGAGIGAAAGSAVGLGVVLATRGRDVDLPAGTPMEIRLSNPLELRQ